METQNIVICGVGGQGNILASDILSYVFFKTDFDVKKSEIHGMSQRNGSVISFIRFGEKVYSPIIPKKKADFFISFEKLEALRYIDYVNSNTVVIINNLEINPLPVELKLTEYPKNIENLFYSFNSNTYLIDTIPIAKELGNLKIINIVLLGFLSNFISYIDRNTWIKSISKFIKPHFLDLNLKAFDLGKNLIENYKKV